jgi:hypothetical protein
MWYMPYLRVRHAVLVYAYVVIGISLAAIALHFWPRAVRIEGHERVLHVAVSDFVAAGAAFVGGFATVLGLNLAAENDGHLELAWTKPVSRGGYALGVFAVDIAAMAACIAFTAVCAAVVVDVYFGYQAVTLTDGHALLKALAFCGLPLCVYAWIAALSASMKRNRGAVAGLFWPLMFLLSALPLLPIPPVHVLASAIDIFNPLAIFSTTNSSVQVGLVSTNAGPPSIWTFAWGWAVAALLLTAALFQWRRLEL